MTPAELEAYIAIFAKPTAGLFLVVVLILYREAVLHTWKTFVDVIASRLRK